jgi:hypothetical protein
MVELYRGTPGRQLRVWCGPRGLPASNSGGEGRLRPREPWAGLFGPGGIWAVTVLHPKPACNSGESIVT